jgi:glycosyltransferase involved in cell wall biosynthesis
MKVLHVIPSLSSVHGGPTKALFLMEQALTLQGIAVETATTDDDGAGRRNGKSCGRPLPENGAVHWYFTKRGEFYKPAPSFARWIAGNARSYDLIHIHALFSFTTSAAAWAAHRAGVPYVVRPLGTLNGYGLSQRRPALKRVSMRFVEGPLLRRAAAIHFTSEAEAAEARQLGIPMKEVIVPLAVESAPAGAASTAVSPFGHLKPLDCALFLSRLDPKKNLEGLLAAIALLKSEMPRLHLLVAGDGVPEYVARLKALAASLGIEDRVTWAGYLEGDRKAAAFAAASVFVLPSFSENFGIAAAEALAAGLPCVLSTGVAIAKEVTQAQAGIATGTDPHGISEAVRRIIIDKEGLAAMSVNSRRLASERFSLGAMGAGLKQLYTEILNR